MEPDQSHTDDHKDRHRSEPLDVGTKETVTRCGSGLVAGIVLLTHRNLVTPGLQFFGKTNGSEGEGGRRGRHASGDVTVPPPLPT